MFPETSNMKVSVYNALFILGVVIVFVPLLKFAMTTRPIPGLAGLVEML